MTRGDQASSDPLPFTKVDRAAKPKAALLAGVMGTTPQHALGSMIEFWDLCSEVRELERIVEATPDGQEPERLLARADAERLFRLASGRAVAIEDLCAVGLLEDRGEQVRVRGMSRQLDTISARLRSRRAAQTGGRASAAARKGAHGTAQPRSSSRSGDRSETVRESLREPFESRLSDGRTSAEAGSNPRGQRTEDRGQLEDQKQGREASSPTPLELLPTPPQKPPKPSRKPPDPEAEFARFRSALTPDEASVFEAFASSFDVDLGPDWGLKKFVGQKLVAHPALELIAAIRGAAKDPWHREKGSSLRSVLRDASYIAQLAKRGAA